MSEKSLAKEYMEKDLAKRGFKVGKEESVERADIRQPKTHEITFVGNKIEKNLPAVKEVANNEHINKYGVIPPHPLSLMTELADNSSWVDLCMRVIGSAASSCLPLFRFEMNNVAKSYKKSKQKDIDKISEILEYPNLHQTGYELFRTIFENLVLYGNAYVQVIKTKGGDLHSMYTLQPESIRIAPYLDHENVLHFAYVQVGNVSSPRVFLEDELIHFKTGNSKSFVYGKPLFLPQLLEIAGNINSQKSIASWFEQGYTGGAIFKMDADEEVSARNRDYLKEYFTKPENFGRTMLLEGNMELVKDGNKFAGFDFSALANTNRDNIIMAAGVPLSQAGVRSAAGNANAEIVSAEETAFVRNTLSMYHRLVFDKLNARLLREMLGWKDIKITAGVPVKFAMTDSIETVRALAEYGITQNEARELLAMPRVPDDDAGNQYLTSTNNGVLPTAKITGIDPNTGDVVETVFEAQQRQQEELAKASISAQKAKGKPAGKAKELSAGASGLGGSLKKAAEGS